MPAEQMHSIGVVAVAFQLLDYYLFHLCDEEFRCEALELSSSDV